MHKAERIRQKIEQLEEEWDLLNEKLRRLRQEKISATRSDERFRIEQEIKRCEQERNKVEVELGRLEQELQQCTTTTPELHDIDADEPESPPPPPPELDAYLRQVFQTTLSLDLDGIDPQVAASKQRDACLNLPDVYTALLTKSTTEHETRITEKCDLPARKRLRSAVEMLNAEQRLVLLGEPGSGKSMFVKFVTLCMAGELLHNKNVNCELLTSPLPDDNGDLEEEAQPWDWKGLLPLKFVLCDVAAKTLPKDPNAPGKLHHLLDYLEQFLADWDLSPAFAELKAHLDAPGGIVLFDGLDEVPEGDRRREQIIQAVEAFADRFSNCRILVTCRTYAYQQQAWRLKNFPVAVLSPFTDGQIRWFVNGWYRHLADRRGTNRADWQGCAEELKRAIFRNGSPLRGFARRPLLLTLMTSLHAWRGGRLPEKRVELYKDATDMLLETWVERKTVRAADGSPRLLPGLDEVLKVSKDELKPVLQQLAFEAHERQPELTGTADISQADLLDKLSEPCRRKEINLLQFTDHLSHRVGLLLSHGNGVYTFPHRSFQEYLAACYLTSEAQYPYNIADLMRESHDRWREVALLTAAKISEAGLFNSFVEAFCPEPPPHRPQSASEVAAYAVMLAAQAVTEGEKVTELDTRKPEQLRWLREWLKAILTEQQPQHPLPVLERARAGDLLARLGDDRPGVGLHEDGLPNIEWCEVPAGSFLMGSADDDKDAYDNEKPQHKVELAAFRISRYPITNVQYRAFIKDGGYTAKWRECWVPEGWDWRENDKITEPNWTGLSNHPVMGVSWYEAAAFCAWLTRCLRKVGELGDRQSIRLPSEAEWEYAARGPESWIYPWGDHDISPEFANYFATNLNTTSAVGCFPRGRAWCGAEELCGNVWDWCLDTWHENYEGAPDDGIAWIISDNINQRLLKGGSLISSTRGVRCAYRLRIDQYNWSYYRGFRLISQSSSKC